MLPQIADFAAEADDLDAPLTRLKDADFERTTAFKGWTINDVLRHLHFGDTMAMTAIDSTAAFRDLRASVQSRKAAGLSTRDEHRERLGHLSGHRLREAWRRLAATLCDRLATLDPETRIAWAGPDMGVRMFTTARQMEVWSHGQEIYDVLGLDREPAPRLKNIATIGVRTFGWTFANRSLPPPGAPPHVRLVGPNGDIWDWNPPQSDNCVDGSALEFCQVVTQVRNVADTSLKVTGMPAEAWMRIAQCFAGPPETPPAPGSRRKAATPIV